MKKLLLLVSILFSLTAYSQQAYLNVRDFGAISDDGTDDTDEINECISMAASLGKDVFLPSGIYICATASTAGPSTVTGYSLRIDSDDTTRMKVFGEKGTVITTNSGTNGLFFVYKNCIDCTFENIFFRSTHSLGTTLLEGFYFAGTSANSIKNLTFRDCRFEGFPRSILIQGVVGMTVDNCTFESPRGHDDATNDDQPAVYIWFADNSDGQCYNVNVTNCFANGYSGASAITSLTTDRPMDGFLYGTVYGINVSNNVTKNFAQEHYYLNSGTLIPTTSIYLNYPTDFNNNQLYCKIPSGSVWHSASLISNYGIRYDWHNINIRNNTFYDYTSGILIYPYTLASPLKAHGFKIEGNIFYSPRSSTYKMYQAIKIQGSSTSGKEAYNIDIKNNSIDIDSITLQQTTSAIGVYNSEKVTVTNNSIRAQNVTAGAYSLYGIILSTSKTIYETNNTFSGLSANYSFTSISASDLTPSIVKELVIDNSQHSITGTTSETTLATFTVKGYEVYLLGSLDIDYYLSCNSNANNKMIKVKVNGNTVSQYTATTNLLVRVNSTLRWRNSTTCMSGAAGSLANTGLGASSSALSTYTIDPTADMTITITGTLANSADNVAIESLRINGYR